MSRSEAELLGLEFEAERLVRSGESRAEVSRRLGVHVSTLSQWALKGKWRKKDLDLERSSEATRRTLRAIRDGNRAVDAQAALRAELAVVMREAVRLMAEGGEGATEKLDRMLSGMAAPRRLEAPKPGLGPDPRLARVRSLGEMEPESGATEHGEVWTPELQRPDELGPTELGPTGLKRGEEAG
jgi:transposase-like protein